LEIVGTYNPKDKDIKSRCSVKKERVDYWLSKGATTSKTVEQLIKAM
jgi:ribosomal protein S16